MPRIFMFLNLAIVVKLSPIMDDFDIWQDSKNVLTNTTFLQRLPRVLNFFPVPFEEECKANDGRRKGVCMNTYECRIQGGSSFGPCALGFGVCCVFTTTCGNEVYNNITYFVNPNFPDLSRDMSSCTVMVQKIDPEIVQLRLDFIHFNLGQPNRKTGICDDDIFTMSGGAGKELQLCGINSGQHVYFDVDNVNTSIIINMTMGNRVLSRFWEVRLTQIPFSQRAPPGCLQYHTGSTGIIQTLNFAENGRRLANQEYNICTRQEMRMCSIAYEPCHEQSFKIGPGNFNSDNGISTTGVSPNPIDELEVGSGDGGLSRMMKTCADKIFMPCDSEDLIMPGDFGPGYCELAHCGSSLCPLGESPCRIESSVTPFTIGVQFGAAAKEESPEDNLGMCLKYEQLPCME